MGKRKYIRWAVLFLLAASVTGACLYCYPAWKVAKMLQEKLDASSFSYELAVELDEGMLPIEQRKVFEILSKLTGIREQSLYRLTIKGSTQDGRICMTIYPEGAAEPLLEFFFENDTGVINEAILYDAVRSHLVGQYTVLDYLMPRQKENLYMTLVQVEQLFGVDFSKIHGFHLSMADSGLTAKQFFVMLVAMKRERQGDGNRFILETESVNLCFDVPGENLDASMTMRFQMQNPAGALAKGEWLLSRIGIQMPEVDLSALKSISVVLVSDEDVAVTMPTNYVNQDIINILSKIWTWLSETFADEGSGNGS